MCLLCVQNSVTQYRNVFVVDSSWSVASSIRDVDPDTTLSYERLDSRLQQHRAALQKHLADKGIVRRELNVLRLVAFLTTLLVAMRRRMKVPDIARLLPNMTSECVCVLARVRACEQLVYFDLSRILHTQRKKKPTFVVNLNQ
jgi:hypothetical protein